MSRVVSFARYWLPVFLWMALIFSVSSDRLSAQRSSRIIGPIVQWLFPGLPDPTVNRIVFVVRKGAHVAEYAVLALLVWRARRQPARNDPRPWRWSEAALALAVAVAYAATDEFHQTLVPSRQGSVWDVVLDSGGAALGLLLVWGVGRWRRWW